MGNNLLRSRIIITVALMLIVPGIIIAIAMSLGGNKELNEAAQRKSMSDYTERLNQRNVDVIFYNSLL